MPVEVPPPETELGDSTTENNVGCFTRRFVDFGIAPGNVAEISAVVFVEMAVVLIGNVANVLPAKTVTDDAGLAHDWFDDRVTVKLAAVGPVSVTLLVTNEPPAIDPGLTLTD